MEIQRKANEKRRGVAPSTSESAKEEGASPPRIALDKKLEEDTLMEEKKERRMKSRNKNKNRNINR